MRGRDLCRLFGPVFLVIGFALKFLPASFCEHLLALTRNLPGQIAIGIRYTLLKRCCKSCGHNVAIFEGVFLRNITLLNIGSNVSIHPMCYVDALGGLTIGNDVAIAHGVSLVTHNHDYRHPSLSTKDAPVILGSISIDDRVWIGAGAKILAGVSVGENAVIGAGSVVTRDVPESAVSVGVPAKCITPLQRKRSNL